MPLAALAEVEPTLPVAEPAEIVENPPASFREVFGLPTEPRSGEPMQLFLGEHRLTEAELETVAERLHFQQQVTASVPYVRQALRESLAGVWFDLKTGSVHVAVAGALPPLEAFSSLTGLPANRVVLHQHRRSLRDLDLLLDQLRERSAVGDGYQLVGASVDEEHNRIIIEATGDLSAAARDFTGMGDAVAITRGDPPQPRNASRDNPGNPPKWEAGMRVITFLGRTLANPFLNGCGGGGCHDADVQAISINAPGDPTWTLEPDCVYLAPNNCRNLDAFGDPVQGTLVCGSGASYYHPDTYTPCHVVESVNFSGFDLGNQGFWLMDVAKARLLAGQSYCLAPGDSGSPTYEVAPAAWPGVPQRYTAVGIYYGGNGDCTGGTPQIAYFSRWTRIKTRLGEIGLAVSEPEPVAQPRLQTGARRSARSPTSPW